ncbi:HAD family hydrolase [Vibrio gazogenes]|uniref:phosphoglycolate phosphatase n=1 Tax=Vibrio gazogenes DSM 21264 = NBRC 103151 TaxID=1123492 RepID=A0A1M5G174_VIBGA|nr:HAD family hydrolase [Vibrio gazogenes]USP14731.1 HAD family hydrolase [Vibrio gazogenes]SHF97478.1 phosphoglycolate phosphatase [Vibrio gazogenes DSM 21264] [Vibrio gazogenes DSM 21264 = NBRC 103151]SJN59119.1 Phosphorylated carbohydrates phosphatase [Vibrio gazogenes]
MTKFKALLFDKDGTLLEFHNLWLNVSRGASEMIKGYSDLHQGNQNITITELLFAIGVEGDVVLNHGLLASNPVEDTAQAWFELLKPEVSIEEFTKVTKAAFNNQVKENPDWVEALPGVTEKLSSLKQQGMHLGIATADTKDSTLYSLSQSGLTELFDYIGYSDGDIEPKPAPALLDAFCQQCGIKPHEVIMFGDTVSDMEFGHNAGAKKVGVLTGTALRSELEPVADLVIPSVAHFDLRAFNELD